MAMEKCYFFAQTAHALASAAFLLAVRWPPTRPSCLKALIVLNGGAVVVSRWCSGAASFYRLPSKLRDTPKGWLITYHGHKDNALLHDNLQEKRRCADVVYEERHQRALHDRVAHNPLPTLLTLFPPHTAQSLACCLCTLELLPR